MGDGVVGGFSDTTSKEMGVRKEESDCGRTEMMTATSGRSHLHDPGGMTGELKRWAMALGRSPRLLEIGVGPLGQELLLRRLGMQGSKTTNMTG